MGDEQIFKNRGFSKTALLTFFLVFTLFFSQSPVFAQEAQAILTVEVLEVGIDVELFQAIPSVVYENETTTLSFTIRNLGSYNLDILPTSRIEIYKDNKIVHQISVPTVTISPGARMDFLIPWNVTGFPLGFYKCRIVIDWISAGFTSTKTAWTTLEILPLIPLLPPLPPPAPPVFYRLRVLRFPLLIEERAGDTTLASFEILNEGPGKIENARIWITVAENWMLRAIEPFPSVLSLEAEERRIVNLLLKIPATVSPGDYGFKITVRAENSIAEMISILRVRSRFPDPYAMVVRHIDLDLENEETVVKLIAKNGSKFLKALLVTDNILSDFQGVLDRIAFLDKFPEDISLSGVTWRLESVQPFEEREILYRLPAILPVYQRYLYWAFPRVVMIYELVELVRIVELKSEFLKPAKTGRLILTLRNISSENLLVTAILRLPIGWTVQPDGVSMKLEPTKSGAFVFYVTLPEYVEPMTYMGEVRIYFKDQEIVRGIAFVVLPPQPNILLIIAIILSIIAICLAIYLLMKRRWSSSRRPEIVEILRRAGEEA
ncbi:MAG: hypothetical protein QXW92_04705 [Candidatus Hadarchaeales archaeon]